MEPDLPPSDPDPSAADDPEIAALLDFAPVVRHTRRRDGWPPERQRGFIVGLASLGNVDRAAQSVGRTASGAWKVRVSAGADGFAAAWDAALALHRQRNPPPVRRSHAPAQPGRGGRYAKPVARVVPGIAEDEEEVVDPREVDALWEKLLEKYRRKLAAERACRLEGRIAEADFYVRQLTWLEIVFDLGGRAMQVLGTLKQGDMEVTRIAATPMSILLERIRRGVWLEKGEADRPPSAPLGTHDDRIAYGSSTHHRAARDGDYDAWCRRQDAARAHDAEAQQAWEEKARAEAAAWAAREGSGSPSDCRSQAGEGEGSG